MPEKKPTRKIITDKLVLEKTGKTLEELYVLFDKKDAKKLSVHSLYYFANNLPELEPLGEWNRGLLCTSYAWSRGMRQRGEKENGFEISVSKTIGVALPTLYSSFIHEKIRLKWLGKEKLEIRKCTENKSARVSWSDGSTSLSIDFYHKGEGKAQIVVQHQKISDSQKAEELKVFWNLKLNALKNLLEKQTN